MTPRKLILENKQSPGDVVVLTAAVRDLHRLHPGKFVTDVRGTGPALWENNPYITRMREDEQEVEAIRCEYPLIHRSNTGPWHFIHAFHHFLGEKLGVRLEPTEFRGDIHLSEKERGWMSQVQEVTREAVPYWVIVAGGKYDFTAKWWAHERWQTVVDRFRGRILFVQAGEAGHNHPALEGVLDLRGKTDLRQLVRLVHHAQGVACGVTLAMHLAAAVPVRGRCAAYPRGMPKNRPCVVVAGGREPMQWEAYPHHQYLHTNGALPCCDNGGCWKSRVVPLGDGDKKDKSLCVDAVDLAAGGGGDGKHRTSNTEHPTSNGSGTARFLPRCLDMISAEDVIRRLELYFAGGVVEFLTEKQRNVSACALAAQEAALELPATGPKCPMRESPDQVL